MEFLDKAAELLHGIKRIRFSNTDAIPASVASGAVLQAGTRLDSIKIGSTVLERGTDYTYNATNGTIRLLKETLAKKSKGTYTVTFVPNQGSSFTCSLSVVDTAPVNEVVPGTVDFDANTSSGGYADLVVTLNMVDGAALKNIRSNGKTLEENWQYKINESYPLVHPELPEFLLRIRCSGLQTHYQSMERKKWQNLKNVQK